ncbi:hypothetical protein [Roseibacillus persicicus]|uniref:Uncharacterized protein n=1 Tax=Roseibacillus persicicus TaxID=454148 RepID=A0A918TQH3_9BACT|nr:hypothetical protein [Roseibacillus persicicus]GHC56504.1 hypothetical protein GCM10007100_24080 [Roseibacillus persicicus]
MTEQQIQETLTFFEKIGIEAREVTFEEGQTSCVPGISCLGGTLKIDRALLQFPGDLYYAAGRIAASLPAERPDLDDNPSPPPALEMAAMAWAFAAAEETGVGAEHVFHPSGYHGQSTALIEAYRAGTGPGIPLITYFEMAEQYPRLTHWLRPSS